MFRSRSPKPQSGHESQIEGFRNGRGRAVDDASPWQLSLQLDDRRRRPTAVGTAQILYISFGIEFNVFGLVTFVEQNQSIKVFSTPIEQLAKSGSSIGNSNECPVGGKDEAFLFLDFGVGHFA